MKIRSFVGGLLASAALIGSAQATTLSYSFTEIANTRGEISEFAINSVSINNRGEVAFRAFLRSGGESINVGDGTSTQEIANTDGAFSEFGILPTINNNGDVAFFAILDAGGESINVGDGTSMQEIANTSGAFLSFGSSPSINDNGDVAFHSFLDIGGESINVSDGTTSREIAGPTSVFSVFAGEPSINNNGDVAFNAFTNTDRRVIVVSDGTATQEISDSNFLIPQPSINDNGDVAFRLRVSPSADGESINVGDGTTTQQIANTEGPFLFFNDPSINNNGDVAFLAALDGGESSINVFSDGMMTEVLRNDGMLSGLVVQSIFFGRQAISDKGDLAFWVRFTDGSEAIYRADFNDLSEIPLPAALPLFLAGIAGLGVVRRRRKKTAA